MQNKKFYIGISPLIYFGTINEYQKICSQYKTNIDYWYLTPPFGECFQNRSHGFSTLTLETVNELLLILQNIRNNDQKIQLAFNAPQLKNVSFSYIDTIFSNYNEVFGIPDSIVCLDHLIPYFKQFNLPITYSFNNYFSTTKLQHLKDCQQIVLGTSRYLHNLIFMQQLKEKYNNINIELLLNNGCHYYCDKICGDKCEQNFYKRANQIDYITLLAEQTILPFELNYYPSNFISNYKISSRPISYQDLSKTLYFYIDCQQLSINKFLTLIDLTKSDNWKFFTRLTYLTKYIKQFEPIDIMAIIDKKQEIWYNELLKIK